ncbi:MAG TPA: hypothetical protein VL285_07850 [Bryobacteraceae bacterium]|jgi:hypothetical protein|nr:hypothetical protein [Bryobacteraceae bacterium]
MKTQKDPPDAGRTNEELTEFAPKQLTPRENFVLTVKVLGTVAAISLIIWLIHEAKG